MSLKSRDKHNRWRNKTVAFRVSPEEDTQIETFVKLRLEKICRTTCDGILLIITKNLVNNLRVERLNCLTILTKKNILSLLSSNLVSLTHEYVKYSLCTNDL